MRSVRQRRTGIRELNSLKKDYQGYLDDTMLARRWKRKCVADRKSEPNPRINATKKRIICNPQEEIQMRDKDYEEFLNDLCQNGDDGQDYLDIWCGAELIDDGDDNANGKSVHYGNDDGLDGDGVDDDVDPQYKVFLENLREVGKSYALEIVRENGNVDLIKYEEVDGIVDGPNLDTTVKKSPVKEKTEKRPLRGAMKKEQVYLNTSALPFDIDESESPRTVRYANRKRTREIQEDSEDLPRKKSSGVKKITKVEVPEKKSSMTKKKVNEKAPKGSTKRRPNKRPHLEVPHFAERGAKFDLQDDDYAMFLNNTKVDGGKLIYTPPNGRLAAVILEPEMASSSVDVDSGRCVETRSTFYYLFRNGVMKDLQRPYDQEEYEKLCKEVSHRRPVIIEKELRNGSSRTHTIEGEFEPSYKQQHIVLGRKIKAARADRPRILNLLRGFFYWLKNVAQEGSFCPWVDPACLKVLPPLDKNGKLPQLGKERKLGKKRKFSGNYK